MPERKTIERAKRDKREGKSASTQAGEKAGSRRASCGALIWRTDKANGCGVDIPLPFLNVRLARLECLEPFLQKFPQAPHRGR